MTITANDAFRAAPRISRDGFRRVINMYADQSVIAERDAGAYFDAIASYGIDPLFELAMFNHESTMGKYGMARTTHSWGNTRPPSFGVPHLRVENNFSVYRDWLDGAKSTAARLVQHVYKDREAIREIFIHPSGQVWAPAGDSNDPDGYLNAVIRDMNAWADGGAPMAVPTEAEIGAPVEVIWAADVGPARAIADVRWFVVHKTEGNRIGDIPTLTLPTNPVASAHCWIGRDGTLVYMVRLDRTAWCCANQDVDVKAINAELEGFEDEPTTDAQYRTLAAFFRWCRGQGMMVPSEFVAYDERPGIIGHKHVADPDNPGQWGGRDNHVDPGPLFDFGRLVREIIGTPSQPAEPVALRDGNPHGAFGYLLGFRAHVLKVGAAVYPQNPELGALAVFGWPVADEYVGTDGHTYQPTERYLLEYIPGNAPPWDVVGVLRGAPVPKARAA